jgi:hypothetical protein
MSSAFKTFTSAAGVGSACYLLAMATWDQVLLLFLAASLGWCLFVHHTQNRKPTQVPRSIIKKKPVLALPINEPVVRKVEEAPRKVYKFPIHELAAASTPRSVQAFE